MLLHFEPVGFALPIITVGDRMCAFIPYLLFRTPSEKICELEKYSLFHYNRQSATNTTRENSSINQNNSPVLIIYAFILLIKYNLSWEKDWKIKREFSGRKQLATLVFQIVSLIGETSKEEERGGFMELARDQKFTDMAEYMYDQIERGRLVLQKLRH